MHRLLVRLRQRRRDPLDVVPGRHCSRLMARSESSGRTAQRPGRAPGERRAPIEVIEFRRLGRRQEITEDRGEAIRVFEVGEVAARGSVSKRE